MALPSDFAQRLKSTVDIVRIVGESVRLKKAGSNWIGLCPFHQEKTASFSVHSTRQFYYCFGCGARGDVFRFVMETELRNGQGFRFQPSEPAFLPRPSSGCEESLERSTKPPRNSFESNCSPQEPLHCGNSCASAA
jgi:hypothetical protein